MNSRDRLIELIYSAVDGCARYWAEKIADYLIANGVIVSPCKVGDTVYIKNTPFQISFMHIEDDAIAFVIQFDCLRCEGCHFYKDVPFYECVTNGYIEFTEKDIGETVFLTREEAEKALEMRKEDKGK